MEIRLLKGKTIPVYTMSFAIKEPSSDEALGQIHFVEGWREVILKIVNEEIEVMSIGAVNMRKLTDPLPERELDWSLDDGDVEIGGYWEEAVLRKEGNPVELRFLYYENSHHLLLDNVENASLQQCKEMLAHRNQFPKLINFKQSQRGGRPKQGD